MEWQNGRCNKDENELHIVDTTCKFRLREWNNSEQTWIVPATIGLQSMEM